MSTLVRAASALAAAACIAPAAAQPARTTDELQVALWASACMACHGTDGLAEGAGMTIGGRQEQELYGYLIAFKIGQRPATIMQQHAKGYSDDELRRIARYFSQVKGAAR